MKIIVEGANGTGKSTLCLYLSSELNLPVIWAGPKPDNDEIAIIQCQRLNITKLGIFDRATCISRPVYGDNNEDVNGLSDHHLYTLNRYVQLLIKNDVIFIHCVGNGDHEIKNYYTPFHLQHITKYRAAIRMRYIGIFEDISHFEYDFAVQSNREVLECIHRQF